MSEVKTGCGLQSAANLKLLCAGMDTRAYPVRSSILHDRREQPAPASLDAIRRMIEAPVTADWGRLVFARNHRIFWIILIRNSGHEIKSIEFIEVFIFSGLGGGADLLGCPCL